MPRGWTTISIYLDKNKYEYYSQLAELRGQSRNSMLVQLVDYAINQRHQNESLMDDWEGVENDGEAEGESARSENDK